ncbi:MAG: WcaF family extracellular polysaccharide biosynthesis acetyltransferase [Cyanobacteria bacterium]|nr:WcaF family extracellular polysaccharide biosynthesis acetyltransferase [Cyanobacteriota bacterium]
MAITQNLNQYRLPADFSPGRSRLVLSLWFVLGSPLLRASWLPGSAWRVQLLRRFGASLGRGCRLKPGLRVKFPWRLSCGDHCWLGEDVWIDNLASVTLGDRVCLSQGAYLCTGNHDYRSSDFGLRLGPITIGSDAWIGACAVLAPGTCVGEAAVVSLAAVASGIVPAATVVRGNPALPTGARFERFD